MRRISTLVMSICTAVAATPLVAQTYPTKPLRVVVSFPPGGGVDFLARQVAQQVSVGLGQAVVVDNRAGGNTIIAAESVARSPADGYTILHALDFTMTQNPSMYANLPYDPVKDFTPVAQLSVGMAVIVTHPKSPFSTLKELVAYGKANPGKLNFAASAVTTRLVGETLRSSAGLDMVFVPYKGTVPMVQAILAQEIDLVIDGTPVYVPHIKEGKLRALAVTGDTRYFALPGVPTTTEAGFPQLKYTNWIGWFMPAGTPQAIVTRINAEVGKALADKALQDRLTNFGFEAHFSTASQLAARVKEDLAYWGPLIKAAGIKPE